MALDRMWLESVQIGVGQMGFEPCLALRLALTKGYGRYTATCRLRGHDIHVTS